MEITNEALHISPTDPKSWEIDQDDLPYEGQEDGETTSQSHDQRDPKDFTAIEVSSRSLKSENF